MTWEDHVGECYSLGRVDRSQVGSVALRRFSEDGSHPAYEESRASFGQDLQNSSVRADEAALGLY